VGRTERGRRFNFHACSVKARNSVAIAVCKWLCKVQRKKLGLVALKRWNGAQGLRLPSEVMSFQIHVGFVRKPLASYYLSIFVQGHTE